MRKFFTFLVLAFLFQSYVQAQIPTGYYDSAIGKTGSTLKTALFNIIKNPAVTSYTGLWTSFQTTDKDIYYENDGTVMDMYSENPSSSDPYEFTFISEQCGTYASEGDCYNREHSFPKSWFNDASPMYSDLFHIYPTDGKVNGMRSNYPYGPNNGENFTSMNGSKLGSCTASGYTGLVFEPIDEFKGDLARTYFYMATCYEDKISGWSSDVLDGSSFLCYNTWFLDILLEWNTQDPVSQKEIDRNNAVYAIQGNRNPFIDHPEYVSEIWGGSFSSVPSTPSNFALNSTTTQINLSWTDVSNETGYYLYRSTNNITFATLATLSANTTSYSDASVVSGTTYYYYIKAYNAEGTSGASNTVSGQLSTSGGSVATDLFFSEYVEGSSYNKALEISNFTGNSIDLSSFVIKKQSNGAGDWSTGLSLSGTISQGQSYVIANSYAGTTVLDKADLTTNVTELNYNGNDAVSLWKNGVLIDIIGVFNSSTVFGADVTKIRNSNVSSPNTTYTTSEWTDYSIDYFDNLGIHTFDGSTPVEDTQAPTAPTGLASSNITTSSCSLTWSASTDNVGVTGYDVYKNGTFLASTTSTSYNVSGLSASTTYSFYVKSKDAAGNVSAASSSINTTTLSSSVTYCASKGSSVTDEWIGKVVLGSISNSSTNSNGGYSDFTAISTTLNTNTAYTITITPTWSGTIYSEGEAIWIDYNQDGDFTDAGELVASIATSKNSPVSATFTVPATALNGTTRMRVSMKYNGIPTSCETFSYGEVEDYTVVISTGTPDTQAPSAPTSLAASSITTSSLSLSWTASTDNVGVTGYDVYRNGSFLASTTSTSYSVSGLTASTTYSFYVKAKDAAGNVSASSNTVNATTLAQTITYCTANGTNTNYEYINRVVFGSIDKTSGSNGGYADYTSLVATVNTGSAYSFALYPGFASSTYNEGWAIWIDYNHDGDFADAGELVYSHSATSVSVSGSVTISSSAIAGNTRMRVKMEYNATPSTSCGSFTYGEVEDYTVNIVNSKSITNIEESANAGNIIISIYPNPAKDKLFIDNADNSDVYIYSLNGKLILHQKLISNSVDVSLLEGGMYLIKINNDNQIYNYKFIKQ